MKSLAAGLAILLFIGLVIVLVMVLMGEDDMEEGNEDETSRPDMEA